ncbi:RNA polymerase sigma factor [candidate division WOR-3 bacterium]|nr:RNA polymerase sigma factor [candidate division WOR-3 bacterium]
MENEIDFENIYKTLWEKIYRVCYRFVGETEAFDAAQETFLKFYKSKDRFRGESSHYTYIYRIAVNLCLDKIKKKVKYSALETLGSDLISYHPRQEDPLIKKRIAKAFISLSKQKKAVLVLRILEGFSIKDTAEIMQLSEGAVKTHLFLAIKEMAKKLEGIRSEVVLD